MSSSTPPKPPPPPPATKSASATSSSIEDNKRKAAAAASSSRTGDQKTAVSDVGKINNENKRTPLDYYKDLNCNGLTKAILCDPCGSRVEVSLYGAQVMSWKNNKGEELLFVSKKANFNRPPMAIRGGIPVCFPQFSTYGPMQHHRHGFARNRLWNVDIDPPPFRKSNFFSRTFIDLILRSNQPNDEEKEEEEIMLEEEEEEDEDHFSFLKRGVEEDEKEKEKRKKDLKIWNYHRYECRLRVSLTPDGDLVLTSRIRNVNTNGESFSFTFAFHNYFPLSDIEDVRVEGLETLHYLDNMKDKERDTEQVDAMTFESTVDKVFLDTPSKITIIDHQKLRTFVIRKNGLPDAFVWNPWGKESGWSYPWEKKAKVVELIEDMEKDDYKHMLCVGPAAVEKPIKLEPGEEWTGWQWLSVVPTSYYSG